MHLRTMLLLAALTALFMATGYAVGGGGGMLIALLVAMGMNFFAYWQSDKMVLSMHGAIPVSRHNAPDLYVLVNQLATRAQLPMPALYIIEQDQPNAFATGRDPENAAVAVTTGLMRLLTREELAGVIAHELAHVRSRDTLMMTITATLAGALGMLASFGGMMGDSRNNPLGPIGTLVAVILAPLVATMVQFAISRTREYEADRIGAQICGDPAWLASALVAVVLAIDTFLLLGLHQGERPPWRDAARAVGRSYDGSRGLLVGAMGEPEVLRCYLRPRHWCVPGSDPHPHVHVQALPAADGALAALQELLAMAAARRRLPALVLRSDELAALPEAARALLAQRFAVQQLLAAPTARGDRSLVVLRGLDTPP